MKKREIERRKKMGDLKKERRAKGKEERKREKANN